MKGIVWPSEELSIVPSGKLSIVVGISFYLCHGLLSTPGSFYGFQGVLIYVFWLCFYLWVTFLHGLNMGIST